MGHAARRRVRLEIDTRLDLIPVMSLVVHLIPMLLLAVRFAEFAQHATERAPLTAAPAPDAATYAAQQAARPTIRVTDRGLSVDGPGLAPTALPCAGPCTLDSYDWRTLNDLLAAAKTARPAERGVVVAPDPGVPYEVVVRVFDTAGRRRDGGELFPEPIIATGAGR